MARWFLSGTDAMTAGQEKRPGEAFFSQEAPLGSVVMLASSGASFTTPFGTTLTPERPSIDNIRGAYDAWQERLALNANSRGVFYFCGHGVSDGLTQLLVADDFGENKSRPFDAVFHLSNTVQGTIRKRRQASSISLTRAWSSVRRSSIRSDRLSRFLIAMPSHKTLP